MGIFRGTGGTGDATTDAVASQVGEDAATASAKANAAASSATAAANSATAAETAKDAAVVAQGAAETAETAAETAQTASEAARDLAQGYRDTASGHATTATTKASEASDSAADASKLAVTAEDTQYTLADTVTTGYSALHYNAKAQAAKTAAETAQTAAESAKADAETAESNASTSESNASTHATNASNSATAAATSATAAEAAKDAIDGLYLGAQSSNPTVDGNGAALTVGDWYFNTSDNTTRIYDGSAWNTINPDLVGDSSPQLGGDLDLNSNNITGTGGLNITGDITLSGTVDGRDVAADGTRLDTIEDNADVTDATNVEAAGALMDSEVTNLAQVKAFDSADYATAAQGATADAALAASAVSTYGLTLIDDEDAATARSTLGLGTAATTASSDYLSSTGGTVTGDVDFVSTDAGSSAGPEFTLFRNSASPDDGDYLGQIKFDGKSDTGVTRVYAKITGKTSDVTNGTEDGLIETAVKSNGSNVIVSRQTGTALKLLNGVSIEVDGTVTATGGTSTNWNTAYGWGDHSAAGYLTSSSTLNADNMTTGTLSGGTY